MRIVLLFAVREPETGPPARQAHLSLPELVALIALATLLIGALGIGTNLASDRKAKMLLEPPLAGLHLALPANLPSAAGRPAPISDLALDLESVLPAQNAATYWLEGAGVVLVILSAPIGRLRPGLGSRQLQTMGGPQALSAGQDERFLAVGIPARLASQGRFHPATIYLLASPASIVAIVCISASEQPASLCASLLDGLRLDGTLAAVVQVAALHAFHSELAAIASAYARRRRQLRHALALSSSPAAAARLAERLAGVTWGMLAAVMSIPSDPIAALALGALRATLGRVERDYRALEHAAQAQKRRLIALAESAIRNDDAKLSAALAVCCAPLAGWPWIAAPTG